MNNTLSNTAHFSIGQIIQHKRFNYRGVIIDVDPIFLGTDAWYNDIADSKPPKDRPWYHVLVDNTDKITYVTEQNLSRSSNIDPIQHPQLDNFFGLFTNGIYIPLQRHNWALRLV